MVGQSLIKEKITIPEYFKKYIDPTVDLYDTPKIPCPFHQDSDPSFTFSAEKEVWRCWSA